MPSALYLHLLLLQSDCIKHGHILSDAMDQFLIVKINVVFPTIAISALFASAQLLPNQNMVKQVECGWTE